MASKGKDKQLKLGFTKLKTFEILLGLVAENLFGMRKE
jgi:hypothetical protein